MYKEKSAITPVTLSPATAMGKLLLSDLDSVLNKNEDLNQRQLYISSSFENLTR